MVWLKLNSTDVVVVAHQLNKNFPVKRRWYYVVVIERITSDFDSFLQGNVDKKTGNIKGTSSSSSSFEGHSLQARQKQDWGRGFILLLPQTAALPGSDAGSDVIKPASSFVIQNCQTSCSMWCPMYKARC